MCVFQLESLLACCACVRYKRPSGDWQHILWNSRCRTHSLIGGHQQPLRHSRSHALAQLQTTELFVWVDFRTQVGITLLVLVNTHGLFVVFF